MPGEGLLIALMGVLGTGGVLAFLFVVAYLNPDQAQRLGEMIWSVISRVYSGGNRKAVQYGVQSRLTYFAADLAKETGRPGATDVKIEWAQPEETPNHFYKDNRVVIRLHAYERQDRNLMTASLFYVSDTLVRRAKRYLSKRQARSVDLYAVDRLLTKTAPAAADLLHEEIVGPECDADHELGDLLVDYQRMDRQINAFFPIFIRELNYLAQKVVVKPRDEQLVSDVKELHRFLVRYSDRVVGEEMPLQVQGRFLRCAVMIIARFYGRERGDRVPYVRHLRELSRAMHETIYLVGSAARENGEFMQEIARDFVQESGWTEVDRREYPVILHHKDGTDEKALNLLIVLRSNQSRDYVGEAEEVEVPEDVPTLAAVEAEGTLAPR
jgi:hypothetical protein